MNLSDLIPDADVVLALEPDELGVRILQVLGTWPHHMQQIELGVFINSALSTYPGASRESLKEAIREAWAWLEGAALLIPSPQFLGNHSIRILSRRARQLSKETNPTRSFAARRLPKSSLHPKIREDVWALYHRGKFATAIFEALKAVEVAVRTAARLTPSDIGTKLMRRAFDPETGALTDKTTEPSERQARSDLFAGAIGSYKNPHSHRNVELEDSDEAAEIIMFANHLLRIVDACAESERPS